MNRRMFRLKRRDIVRWASTGLLVLVTLLAGLLVFEVAIRLKQVPGRYLYAPCFTWRREAKVVAWLRKNCITHIPYLDRDVEYRFNSHALRDAREPSDLPEGGVLVIGDSIVEGLYLRENEILSVELERRLGSQGLKFINGGLRFTGPLRQSQVLGWLLGLYKVRGVIWVLNGSDATDERFYTALASRRDQFGVPTEYAYSPWFGTFFAVTLQKLSQVSVAAETLAHYLFYTDFKRLLHQVPGDRRVLCSGLERGLRIIRTSGIPVLITFTPHPEAGLVYNWGGDPFMAEEFGILKDCARDLVPGRTIDLSSATLPLDHYVSDQMHMSPKGIQWLASQLEGDVNKMMRHQRKSSR